jgi:hypothetical protein
MTDELSTLDTDDEEKKKDHHKQLMKAAHLGSREHDVAVWEVVWPKFQSTEVLLYTLSLSIQNCPQHPQCIHIEDELDRIREQPKKVSKKKNSHRTTPHVNLGNTHLCILTGTLWPFMVSQDWYDTTIVGSPELEEALILYAHNPEGFGEEGYAGDKET